MKDERIRAFFSQYLHYKYQFKSYREKKIDNFKRIKFVSWFLRIINPGYGVCKKCGLPWIHCHEKSIATDKFIHVFATCDYCWEHSTLYELKKIYTSFYNEQLRSSSLYGYGLAQSLPEFLEFVQKEYYSKYSETEYRRIIRKQKLENILHEKSLC